MDDGIVPANSRVSVLKKFGLSANDRMMKYSINAGINIWRKIYHQYPHC